jgi:hypothetical protein
VAPCGAFGHALARLRGIAKPPVTVTEPPDSIITDRDVEVSTARRNGAAGQRLSIYRGPQPFCHPEHPPIRQGQPAEPTRQAVDVFVPVSRIAPTGSGDILGADRLGGSRPRQWMTQGFTVVNADLRGSGRSDRTAELLLQQESKNTYDVMQWAAGQPWSDGRVSRCPLVGLGSRQTDHCAVGQFIPPQSFKGQVTLEETGRPGQQDRPRLSARSGRRPASRRR